MATTLDAATHPDAEPGPEFLEMVGRLAGSYCPPLLSTDVIQAARSAQGGRGGEEMNGVESVARAALDAAVAQPAGRTACEDLRP
jgi:hypothetical protein